MKQTKWKKSQLRQIAADAEASIGRRPGTLGPEDVQAVIDGQKGAESHPVYQAIQGAIGRAGR